jgi:hypothetical protein
MDVFANTGRYTAASAVFCAHARVRLILLAFSTRATQPNMRCTVDGALGMRLLMCFVYHVAQQLLPQA